MLLLLTFFGCDPAAQATDLCRDRRVTLDALYTRYGGSALAQEVTGGAIGNVIESADRSEFERKCILLGGGGRPTFLSDKAKAFFQEPESVAACQKVVDKETAVKKLNRELSATDQVICP